VELHKTQVGSSRSSGRAGASKGIKGNANLLKTKNSSPICLFLFNNNVDIKNNNRECRKPLSMLWVRE